MKTITKGNLVSFTYDRANETRYVDVTIVKPTGIEGVDYSRVNNTDSGYRNFKYEKINFDSIKIIATPEECVLPNTAVTVATMLEKLGLGGQFRLDENEEVVIFNKSLLCGPDPL